MLLSSMTQFFKTILTIDTIFREKKKKKRKDIQVGETTIFVNESNKPFISRIRNNQRDAINLYESTTYLELEITGVGSHKSI